MNINMEKNKYIQPNITVHTILLTKESLLNTGSLTVQEDNNGGGTTTTDPGVDPNPGSEGDFARAFTLWEDWE